jgi:hypothetical protein
MHGCPGAFAAAQTLCPADQLCGQSRPAQGIRLLPPKPPGTAHILRQLLGAFTSELALCFGVVEVHDDSCSFLVGR